MISDTDLIEHAPQTLNPRKTSRKCHVGDVASALVAESGEVFVGQCVDTPSGMGFCAEPNAIGSMLTAGESRIHTIVAMLHTGRIAAPCGRCREFIYQVDHSNREAPVIVAENTVVTLAELLPFSG